MSVHRNRKPRPAPTGIFVTTLDAVNLGGGDLRLREAAEAIRDRARANASWSRQIPPSLRLEVGANVAVISSSARPAYPSELRRKHPLFGDREHWYRPPGEKWLGPAADQAGDEALRRYSKKIDDWARELGYR